MSMGFASCRAQTIKFEWLQHICHKEASAFYRLIQKHETDFDALARAYRDEEGPMCYGIGEYGDSKKEYTDEEIENAAKEIDDAFEALVKAFAEKTTVGDSHLELSLCYHDSERAGDCYDEVDGHFWAVDGVYQMSSAGQKFIKYIEDAAFVELG